MPEIKKKIRLSAFIIDVIMLFTLFGLNVAILVMARSSLWYLNTTTLNEFGYDELEAGYWKYCYGNQIFHTCERINDEAM